MLTVFSPMHFPTYVRGNCAFTELNESKKMQGDLMKLGQSRQRPENRLTQYHFGGRSRRILMVCFGSVMSNQRP
jgi:hypothetical protein